MLSVFVIGCGSTEATPAVTGVWGGRIAYLTPNDTSTFYLEQNGAEVEGWGYLHPVGIRAGTMFSVGGTISGGKLDLSLKDLYQPPPGYYPPVPPPYYLRGRLERGRMDATFGTGMSNSDAQPVTLRLFRPNASELAGTWVLTSTTGAPAPDMAGVSDTIIANADGRAWRHRDVPLLPGYSTMSQAMWSRRGNSLVVDYRNGFWLDSLVIQPGQLQSTRLRDSWTWTDHYTRVSTSSELP